MHFDIGHSSTHKIKQTLHREKMALRYRYIYYILSVEKCDTLIQWNIVKCVIWRGSSVQFCFCQRFPQSSIIIKYSERNIIFLTNVQEVRKLESIFLLFITLTAADGGSFRWRWAEAKVRPVKGGWCRATSGGAGAGWCVWRPIRRQSLKNPPTSLLNHVLQSIIHPQNTSTKYSETKFIISFQNLL